MAGMIVAPQPEAVEAGALMLKAGGNAIDAAMVCALVQGVVDPQMCGIAGFGSMQVYMPKKGVHRFIDFHGKAPAAAKADIWSDLIEGETRDGFGFILKGRVNDVGYQSITVPGSLKAYYEAQTTYGSRDWADVVAPAIAQCDAGFVIRPHVYFWWTEDPSLGRVNNTDRLAFTAEGRKIYFDTNGNLKRAGTRVQNPDMAATLRRIAAEGADVFYKGAIAEQIAADMGANGGLLSYADLSSYSTRHVDPVWGRYRDFDLATNQPPGGGVMLLEMLNILENFDLKGIGHNSTEYIRVVCEAMKRATSDKDNFIGDPAFFDVPIQRLTDKGYARELANAIKQGEVANVERYESQESKNTTQICVVDNEGNAVSMTHSLGMPSGVISPGLGFMYNGCMAVFDPRPGHADSLAPGKSRFSSLCPTLGFRDGSLEMAIGAPGGTQIAMGVVQAILNLVDHGMSTVEAVSAPRFSSTSNLIDITNRIPDYAVAPLRDKGYEIQRSHLTFGIAAVHALMKQNGDWQGAADPGHDGMALKI